MVARRDPAFTRYLIELNSNLEELGEEFSGKTQARYAHPQPSEPTLIRTSMLTLCLVLALPAFAQPPDDELGRALTNLQTKVVVVDRSFLASMRSGGWAAFDVGINLAGLVAIGKAAMLKFNRVEHFVLKTAAGGAGLGSMVGVIGTVAVWLRGKPHPQAPDQYRTLTGMNEFFRLKLDDQYAVAARDAQLTQFVLDLNASYDRIDRGFAPR